MKRFSQFIEEDVSQREINDLEKFADRLLNKLDVDIEFTKHFADRVNDKRNKPGIAIEELQSLFKKMAANKGKKIKKHGNSEAILKDMQSDLNLPVVVNWKNGEFEVVNKTIMRKKAFKSPDPAIRYESQVNEGYGGPGMWMPKQKDGKNWIVSYSAVINGKTVNVDRKFRVKSDALDFIKDSTKILKKDDRVTSFKFDKPKPYKK